jgi:hypothetical protein
MTIRWPDATAATAPELSRMATALNHSGWSTIEKLQVVLEQVAPTYTQHGAARAADELEALIRRHLHTNRWQPTTRT